MAIRKTIQAKGFGEVQELHGWQKTDKTGKHEPGTLIYELTAVIWQYGIDACREPVERRKAHYIERAGYWGEHYKDSSFEWADFMFK